MAIGTVASYSTAVFHAMSQVPSSGNPLLLTRACAVLTVAVGAVVLAGWTFDLSLLRSVLRGAVEMKANTAIGLLLAGSGLFMVGNRPSARRQQLALALSLAVVALGSLTLSQYVFGWHLGIDELVFRDNGHAYNVAPGRMSPYTTVAFVCIGLAIAALPHPGFRALVRVLATLTLLIGAVSFLGYFWNASELVTDRWLPPVAVNTAFCFMLLGVGTLVANRRQGTQPAIGRSTRFGIEAKVLGGFIGVALILIVAGRYTYRSGADFVEATHAVARTEQERLQLDRVYASIISAESSQRAYLLSGDVRHKEDFRRFAGESGQHIESLARFVSDDPRQNQRLTELRALVAKRIAILDSVIGTYEQQGLSAARLAIAAEGGPETMRAIRDLTLDMDEAEAAELVQREATAQRDRRVTLIALLLTLSGTVCILALLFYGIRREMMARTQTQQALSASELDVRRLNVDLERRVAERTAELSYQQAFLRKVIDLNRSFIFAKDRDGRFVLVNEAVAEAYGTTVEELTGKTDADFNPNKDEVEHFRLADLAVIDSKQEKIVGEERITDAAGRVRWLYTVKRPLISPEGEANLLLGVSVDITERKRAEEEVRALNADLERRVQERTGALLASNEQLQQARMAADQANRAKSAFLATMSHEIRTPMNGVIGMAEILAHSGLAADQADAVRTIRNSAQSLLSLIDDILDFSKIESGRLELERTPVALTDIVEGVCNSLAPVAAAKGVHLNLFIDPQAPAMVWGDSTRLRQVLYNLAGNAIKFSGGQSERRGRVSIRVDVAETEPLRLVFRISDNGIGMTPQTLATLFAPFSQAEASTTRRFGGTGLGLAICKRLVQLMDGMLAAESTLAEGSVFTVTLPVEVVTGETGRSFTDLTGLDCVVVSATDINAEDFRVYLEHAGARVVLATNLREGARQAMQLRAPVVIRSTERDAISVDAMHTDFACAPGARHLLITRGRGFRVDTAHALTVNGDGLGRKALLRAVAVAAGRASPEVFYESAFGDLLDEQASPPTIAQARAQDQLVLVAEDDVVNQKVILKQLALLGYAAEVADNGMDALRLWRNGRYAALLTDLHMPEMDGYTLVKTIRAEDAQLQRKPIIALTANALRNEEKRAHEAGVDAYLVKPVLLHLLRAALEEWLPRKNGSAMPAAAPKEALGRDTPPVVDLDVLKGFVGDDAQTVRELLHEYLDSARRLSAELREACAANDARRVGAIAHKLKSSSRSVGALALGDMCAGLENASRAGTDADMAQGAQRFEESMAAVDACIVGLLSIEADKVGATS